MPCAAIPTARSAVSRASCARRCARHWRAPSSPRNAPAEPGARPATTSTSPSASSAGSARKAVRWIPSSRRESSNITASGAATSSIPRKCCWRWATATKRRSPPTARATPSIDDVNILPFIFYAFAAILIFAALRVITSRNPVHSALWLVLSFFSAAGVWMLLQAEFLAIVLVLVYVGAVTVLFLFVVMMLDVNFDKLRERFRSYIPVGASVGILILVEMALVLIGGYVAPGAAPVPAASNFSNTRALGLQVYTDYAYPFEIAAVVLLVAIIAAIALTHRTRRETTYQDPGTHVKVRRNDRLRVLKVAPERRDEPTATEEKKT